MSDPRMVATRSTYDAIGGLYADLNHEQPDSVIESMDGFVAALPAGAVVADVGCGPGRDLAALRSRGLRAFGFDLSTGMLRASGLSGVVLADMTKSPIGPGTLDGIWCAAAFLHIPRELSAATLAGFAAALRPGGALHLSVAEGSGDEIRHSQLGPGGDLYYVHHEEPGLTALLESTGFQVVSVGRSVSNRRWLTLGARLTGGAWDPS